MKSIFNCIAGKDELSEGYNSYGIHPWYMDDYKVDDQLTMLEDLLSQQELVAVGECGLDKLRGADFIFQKEIFEKQLILANRYKKPVIIHCVKAFQDVLEAKQRLHIEVPMIIHGFNKGPETASMLLHAGFYFSFGGELLNRTSATRYVIRQIPSRNLFFETDDRSGSVVDIYREASSLLGVPVDALKEKVFKNFTGTFQPE